MKSKEYALILVAFASNIHLTSTELKIGLQEKENTVTSPRGEVFNITDAERFFFGNFFRPLPGVALPEPTCASTLVCCRQQCILDELCDPTSAAATVCVPDLSTMAANMGTPCSGSNLCSGCINFACAGVVPAAVCTNAPLSCAIMP